MVYLPTLIAQGKLCPVHDNNHNVIGIIAINSTVLGPAIGGCRLWRYGDHADLVHDAIRLAEGMSYKNAMAGLPFGGGKAVLQLPTGKFDRASLFHNLARAIQRLGGEYITAEDVGTTTADMELLKKGTRYVAGLPVTLDYAGGDPSPWTAMGVFEAMKAATKHVFCSDMQGLRVAVQGVGNVGQRLCRLLHEAGAILVIADVDEYRCTAVREEFGAQVVQPGALLSADVDILAPCGLGGILNSATIPQIRAKLICGGANNQLAQSADGFALRDRNIEYAPDYVVNAGGIINVSAEYLLETQEQVHHRVLQIPNRLLSVFAKSSEQNLPTNKAADQMAEDIIRRATSQAA